MSWMSMVVSVVSVDSGRGESSGSESCGAADVSIDADSSCASVLDLVLLSLDLECGLSFSSALCATFACPCPLLGICN